MSFLHPTRGQRLDRLSILKMKIYHSTGETLDRFLSEELELVNLTFPLSEFEEKQYITLMYVNALLWNANVRLTRTAAKWFQWPNWFAVQIWKWNNERIALIEGVDRAAGEFEGHEKVGY